MPDFGNISRKDLIKALQLLGFEGPFSGGKHQFMLKSGLRLTIPNPHQSDIGIDLLNKILKQADISKIEWRNLKL